MEHHPLSSADRGDANTCSCYRFCKVGSWLNTSASPAYRGSSWCSMTGLAELLCEKVGIWITCPSECLAFSSLEKSYFISFGHFEC